MNVVACLCPARHSVVLKCTIANVPWIMCYHMPQSTVAFFNCSSAVLLKPIEDVSSLVFILRLINAHIFHHQRHTMGLVDGIRPNVLNI